LGKFDEVYPEAGVNPRDNFMVVGEGRANVVAVQGANGLALPAKSSKLEVSEITDGKSFSTVTNALNAQFLGWNLKDEASTKDYLAAVHGKLNSSDLRLLYVKGGGHGETRLELGSGKTRIAMDVAVMPAKTFQIAFRFVQLTDEETREKKTKWAKSDAQDLLNILNWTYGPQANISFKLADAEPNPVTVPREKVHLEDAFFGGSFLKYVVGTKNKSADLTVFFVKDYISVDKNGLSETFQDEKACVVTDKPAIPVIKGEDSFAVNFAHEVGHFLQNVQNPEDFKNGMSGHHDRENILMSRGVQSTRLDETLMKRVNKP
jgi:hypothetical protein